VTILTEGQIEFLKALKKSNLSKSFYLTRGTALSQYYLKHRISEDLDFFTEKNFSVNEVISFLKKCKFISDIKYNSFYDRRIFILTTNKGILKTEFSFYPFKHIKPPNYIDGLYIDSREDIFVNKLTAISERREVKDYVDILFILSLEGVNKIIWAIEKVKEKFGVKGIEYIIQQRFTEPPDFKDVQLKLIKPLPDPKIIEKALHILIKKYW